MIILIIPPRKAHIHTVKGVYILMSTMLPLTQVTYLYTNFKCRVDIKMTIHKIVDLPVYCISGRNIVRADSRSYNIMLLGQIIGFPTHHQQLTSNVPEFLSFFAFHFYMFNSFPNVPI